MNTDEMNTEKTGADKMNADRSEAAETVPAKRASEAADKPRKSGRTHFPTWGDLAVLLLLFGVATVAVQLVAGAAGLPMPYRADGELVYPAEKIWGRSQCILYVGAMVLTIVLAALWRVVRHGGGYWVRFSHYGLSPRRLLWGVLLMVSCGVVIEPLLSLLDFVQMPRMPKGGWSVLMAVVAAPVLEELLCRGIVLESIRYRYGAWRAWVGSSLFFGLIHLHPAMSVNAFFMGMILGFAVIRTRSVIPAVLLHAFNNALALVLGWTELPGRFADRPLSDIPLRELIGSDFAYTAVYIAAAVFFVLSALEMWREIPRRKAPAAAKTEEKHPPMQ